MRSCRNITRIDENDGGYWVYDYDGRNRLTQADYTTALGPVAHYAYTYDDGDNMTQKVEPFQDDFNDENLTGWNVTGTWSASGGVARNTPTTTSFLNLSNTDPDIEIDFRYTNNDTSSNLYGVYARLRSNSTGTNRLELRLYSNRIVLQDVIGGTVTNLLNSTTYPSTQGQAYDVKCVASGSSVKVYRGLAGEEPALIYSGTTATSTTSRFDFALPSSSDISLDNVRILSSSLNSTWAMTPNDANELTQMSNSAQGTTINYTYDAKGRTSEKAMGAKTAEYSWAYGDMLSGVDTDFVDEADVTYGYGGDHKRRSRTSGGATIGYNWDIEWRSVNEENGGGTLTKTSVYSTNHSRPVYYAEISGSSPAYDPVEYPLLDHHGSTRAFFSASKSTTRLFYYTPYGKGTPDNDASYFAGHQWDSSSDLYYAPYRYLNSRTARWLTSDPVRMVDIPNLYMYSLASPVTNLDPDGLSGTAAMRAFRPIIALREGTHINNYLNVSGIDGGARMQDIYNFSLPPISRRHFLCLLCLAGCLVITKNPSCCLRVCKPFCKITIF